MRSYVRVGLAILACYGAGLLASLFIDASAGSWYASLAKPEFTPPNWVFAPVWFVLYGCMAAALALVWLKDPLADDGTGWVPMFFAHLLANIAWTVFFFGFHAVFIAFICILVLAVAVLLLMCGAWEIDKRASLLLFPYLLWVLFALALNLSIWLVN
jgi:tryptophan-rich sensory protein